jgi:lysine 2,3-aminomutase
MNANGRGLSLADLPSSPEESSWRWQLQNSARTLRDLEEAFALTEEERVGARRAVDEGFAFAIPPYYLGLCDPSDPSCPIRRQVVPHALEARAVPGDLKDPLGEEAHEPAPDLIRRYPDRALLLVTDRCAVYCRFCTRSRMVASGGGPRPLARLEPAFQYLKDHPELSDVIVSGGDPLVMATTRLVAVIERLRGIESIQTIRIATRVPVVLPQRITVELVEALKVHHPIWIMTHFNHPKELTDEARAGCRRLADAGFPVMNHTVLLKGVNDDAATLQALFRGLVRERVRPYYLLQADPVNGTGHLRTALGVGVEIMRRLQGRLSGIALPKLIVDTPGGHGKVPVSPDFVIERRAGATRFLAPNGVEVDYLDPPEG